MSPVYFDERLSTEFCHLSLENVDLQEFFFLSVDATTRAKLLNKKDRLTLQSMAADDENHLTHEALPFADVEYSIEVDSEIHQTPYLHKEFGVKNKSRSSKHRAKRDTNIKNKDPPAWYASFVLFEHSQEANNTVSLFPYTGPCNTAHLHRQLYLPQLVSTKNTDSSVPFNRFVQAYEQAAQAMAPTSNEVKLSMYLRFGISYIIYADTMIDQTLRLKDFIALRNRGSY